MELKVFVSLLIIYIYIFLKTRINLSKKGKQTWVSIDLLFLSIIGFLFIKNDLAKMALYIILSLICCLTYIHKNNNVTIIENKRDKIKIGLVILMSLLPYIIYLSFLDNIIILYSIVSILCYFNDSIILFLNKLESKWLTCYNKKRK